MSRSYRRIKEYEKEIFELKAQGKTNREIREKFGLTKKQLEGLITRHNNNQKKTEAGIQLRKRGRPSKDYVVKEEDTVAQLKYILARKDAKIKSLEMENELMRDFLSHTERK